MIDRPAVERVGLAGADLLIRRRARAASKMALTADGKTLTLTVTGTDAKGQAIHNVTVYTKQ